MQFSIATAQKIIFAPGCVSRLPEEIIHYSERVLFVRGKNAGRTSGIIDHLEQQKLSVSVLEVTGEPDLLTISEGLRIARQKQSGVVVGVGGGSVIDTGKAVAALAPNPGEILDYLEVIGRGRAIAREKLPFIAVPTTAGTGAEVTCNAVICAPEERVKVSLRHPGMFPNLALVDPELTYSLPPSLSAQTGFDALTQLIEPFVSIFATPFTDGICREGLLRVCENLEAVCHDGANRVAREAMSLAGLFGGIALSNAKLGAVHGIAGPLGGLTGAPHGALCAALLEGVMEANIQKARATNANSRTLERFQELACLLTGKKNARLADGPDWVRSLRKKVAIPPLASWGVTEAVFPQLVKKAVASSSMKGNPVVLSEEDILRICRKALAQA